MFHFLPCCLLPFYSRPFLLPRVNAQWVLVMRPKLQGPYLTTRAFVDFVNERWGIGLTLSRFHKDRMSERKVAPVPAARFGNRDLFTEAQASEYVAKLIQPVEQEDDRAA
jgi:hypothetical protein